MQNRQMTIGNLLFWFQVVCAVVFGASQTMKMFESTQGVSFSFFMCHGIFVVLNLSLSLAALKKATDMDRSGRLQSVYTYILWTVVLSVNIIVAVWKMDSLWKPLDTVATAVVVGGMVSIIAVAKWQRLPLLHPYVKAGSAIFLKAVPQVALAVFIFQYGKGGLSGIWILGGHCAIVTRIAHLLVTNHRKWEQNSKGTLASELANEASWLVASIAWILS